MEHLYLNNGFVYLRLQALIWHSNALNRRNKLLENSNRTLINIIDNVDPQKVLIINCKRISDFGHNLIEIISNNDRFAKRKIVFIETEALHKNLVDSFHSLEITVYSSKKLHIVSPENSTYSYSSNDYEKIIEESSKLEQEEVKRIIIDSYIENDKDKDKYEPLPSTAILALGEFNACRIISNPKSFIWLTLTFADKVEQFIQDVVKPQRPYRLMGVSLRGAIFTSAISMLLGLDYDTVDHLGPKHKLFDVDFFNNKTNKHIYIYIGDFIIGGTEVKIAKTYAQVHGHKLEHAFVIGSLFENERFSTFKMGCIQNILEVIPRSKRIDFKLNI